MADKSNSRFYETVDRELVYSTPDIAEEHPVFPILKEFVLKWSLGNKKCLEIGSGKGIFQNIVDDYTGVDIAENLSKNYHKKYVSVEDAKLPFPDSSFDAVFSYATHEHIPDVETALEEIVRVLKPGGVCLLAPAWQTRPWFAGGYQVRPFSGLTLKEKFIKASIPFKDFFLIRWSIVLIRRLIRLIQYAGYKDPPIPLKYRKLEPNYEIYWQSDSDACNSLDQFDILLWFKSRNFICWGHESILRILFSRAAAIELQKAP